MSHFTKQQLNTIFVELTNTFCICEADNTEVSNYELIAFSIYGKHFTNENIYNIVVDVEDGIITIEA